MRLQCISGGTELLAMFAVEARGGDVFGFYVVQYCRVVLGAVFAFRTTVSSIMMSQHLRLNEIIQRFVSISSYKRHSCVGVNHARSVIVSSLSVLPVVVRFLVVSVLQGHSPLLTNTTDVTSAVPGVVSDGGLRLDGDNLLDLVIVLVGGDRGGSLSLWWGNI